MPHLWFDRQEVLEQGGKFESLTFLWSWQEYKTVVASGNFQDGEAQFDEPHLVEIDQWAAKQRGKNKKISNEFLGGNNSFVPNATHIIKVSNDGFASSWLMTFDSYNYVLCKTDSETLEIRVPNRQLKVEKSYYEDSGKANVRLVYKSSTFQVDESCTVEVYFRRKRGICICVPIAAMLLMRREHVSVDRLIKENAILGYFDAKHAILSKNRHLFLLEKKSYLLGVDYHHGQFNLVSHSHQSPIGPVIRRIEINQSALQFTPFGLTPVRCTLKDNVIRAMLPDRSMLEVTPGDQTSSVTVDYHDLSTIPTVRGELKQAVASRLPRQLMTWLDKFSSGRAAITTNNQSEVTEVVNVSALRVSTPYVKVGPTHVKIDVKPKTTIITFGDSPSRPNATNYQFSLSRPNWVFRQSSQSLTFQSTNCPTSRLFFFARALGVHDLIDEVNQIQTQRPYSVKATLFGSGANWKLKVEYTDMDRARHPLEQRQGWLCVQLCMTCCQHDYVKTCVSTRKGYCTCVAPPTALLIPLDKQFTDLTVLLLC